MTEVLKKFGRYFLLDHLAQGGMAEIDRARLASIDGAGRIIVIKRIQGGFGANKEFLQMFKSEIKVTMGFNHPNIVQLYDFGEEKDQPFIAMEWVDGRNIRQLMSRFNEIKQSFPIELVTYIAEQAASGLNYAHSFRDKISGTPLEIVHRDISPQNILISFEGTVKVIDFGIAKATTNIESTRAGVIKGKPSYLSPEQISGEILDGRSDIFALGAVLWEMLTGKKLFSGESDLAVLKQIESCQTHVKPPSTINPKVPKELDYIVLKSLAKHREKRYQNAEEFQRILHKFLFNYMPEFNPSDLSYHVRDLFKNEIIEDRKLIQRLNEKAEELLRLDASDELNSKAAANRRNKLADTESDENTVSAPTSTITNPMEIDFDKKSEPIEVERKPSNSSQGNPRRQNNASNSARPEPTPLRRASDLSPRATKSDARIPRFPRSTTSTKSSTSSTSFKNFKSSGNSKFATIGTIAILILSFIGPQFGINVPILSDLLSDYSGGIEAQLTLEGSEKNITVTINGTKMAKALPATLKGLAVGTPLQVQVTGPDGTYQEEITLRKGERKTIYVSLSQTQSPAAAGLRPMALTKNDKTIQLRLNIMPGISQALITLNGSPIDSNYPVAQAPLDKPLTLRIDSPGFKEYTKEFILESRQLNGLREWPMEIALEAGHFGLMTVHTVPSSDIIMMINGSQWRRKSPVENEKIPVGTYTVQLRNDILGMGKSISVTIEEGKSINIDERLGLKN